MLLPLTTPPPNGKNDVPLFHITYQLYKLFHQYIKLFPKTEKYTLGERIENLILDLLEIIQKASYSPKTNRVIYLEDIDSKIQLLKILIRLTHEVRAIDDKKYLLLQTRLQEMGKMIGGWLNAFRKTNAPI